MRTPRMGVKKRMGVIGTFVWDVIHGRDPRDAPVQEWGGITYSLAGLDAALPHDWEIVPVMKVGSDLARQAREYLATLRRLAPDAALVEVPYPNNRVELRYHTDERRTERLSGGVPGWTWIGLKPLIHDLDALYINMISGFELDLDTAAILRQHYHGPIYCDLHSVVLTVQPDGIRTPHPLSDVDKWCRCFDFLQVNEDELAMMAPDPMALAATAMTAGVRCLVVTLGARGAVYFAAPGFEMLDDLSAREAAGLTTATGESGLKKVTGEASAGDGGGLRPVARQPGGALSTPYGPVRTELIPAEQLPPGTTPDPTGCGDVWGASYFSRLVAGDNLATAIRAANRAAARNAAHRGATGLANHLRGELSLR